MGKHPQSRAERRQRKQEHENGFAHTASNRRAKEALREKEADYELKSYLGKVLPHTDPEGLTREPS